MRNVLHTAVSLKTHAIPELSRPHYFPSGGSKGIALAVESMSRHMTNEGFQIMESLETNGFTLCGNNLTVNETDTIKIIEKTNPDVVVVQDKREWDLTPKDFRSKEDTFQNIQFLKSRNDIFKLTILKDAHQRPHYHKESAEEIDAHAWIVYYHPTIVKRVAPYVRSEDLIRTYHTIDKFKIPEFSPERKGCLLSGAVSGAYPLRQRLESSFKLIKECDYLKHPGYHVRGTETNSYLETLNKYKVAICTSSKYGYALRKIIEASACGCIVVTDLPTDELLPYVESNLVRVSTSITASKLNEIIQNLYRIYDIDRQKQIAKNVIEYYDFRNQGRILVDKINLHKEGYV